MADGRSAKVTDEHRAEAAALKKLWKESKHGLSQAAFGADFKIGTQAAVGFFLNGKSPLSLKAARGFAKGLKCDISDFSKRLAEEAAKNAEFAAPPVNTDGWPFPNIDRERFDRLEDWQRTEIQGLVRKAITDFEAAKVKPSGGSSTSRPEHRLENAA